MQTYFIRHVTLLPIVLAVLVTAGCAGSEAAGDAAPQAASTPAPAATQTAPLVPGEPFPASRFRAANAGDGIAASVDLADDLGRRPIVLTYWIAGHPRADEVLQDVAGIVADAGGDVALYAMAVPRPDRDEAAIAARAGELGLTFPVLLDEGFELGQRLQVRTVPNVTIIDRNGLLRLSNGASLVQELEYKIDLAEAIRRAARGAELMTYGYLGRYFPVKELEGQPSPDFSAPLVTTKVEQRWKSLMADDRINVLIFWSVECGHCRRSLPEFSRWVSSNPPGVNVISLATVFDEGMRVKTREFCLANGFTFPTLVDDDSQIGREFNVTSTPTFVIVGPDGTVDTAILSTDAGITDTILARRDALLPAGS